jgi:hypothetical protein
MAQKVGRALADFFLWWAEHQQWPANEPPIVR